MELYFAPMACSLATRIALYDAGGEAKFTAVDLKAKRTADGADFLTVNPMGQVPALRTEADGVLTENPVVLQYVADHCLGSGLAPSSGRERYRLQLWLNFITSELHKLVFTPLLSHRSNDGARAFARDQIGPRFAYLNAHLDGRDYLLDRFTVADAYLVTVLNWTKPTDIDLAQWPALHAYFRRMHQRASVAKAFAEEMALYQEEQARAATAA
ncbi:MAG TPA: glutathione binding-like protein [Xanthobacteraceae bacterium]|nr:glutathione binding-like protein [Xanthobacteraceae bacterium]